MPTKAYYRRHSGKYKRQARERRKRLVAENYARLVAYLQEHPCVDCNESDPLVLEFDHLDENEKAGSISTILNATHKWETILVEISKCEVVCANCHRRRTHARAATNKYQILMGCGPGGPGSL